MIHEICYLSVVFQIIDITPASVNDIQILKDIKMAHTKCTIFGDVAICQQKFS
jgi:hypothetical protein